MRHLIIGTAGHVDHGKTSLIRALTGIETDRLPEEKARGMSIELGFAYFDLPNGTRAGIVDVPGHERFIDTMVAGAHGIDVVLFVVSAKEGAQRQTVEHLQILDLLDVRHGILVMTMRDLVSDEELEFAIEETRELLEGTTLEGIPHVAVSSTTGAGIDELRHRLAEIASRVQSEDAPDGIPRLPIDRVFTMEGFGVVVTGTLHDGVLDVEQRVRVMPSGLSARIRNIQVHGENRTTAWAGQRTALNLVGIEKELLNRGDTVTLPELDRTTTNLDVSLRIVDDFPRIVEHWTRARLYIGTTEVFGRIVLLVDEEGILPGASTFVQLRLEASVLAVRGDRFVLRDASAEHTLGGGIVLDPIAPRRKRFSAATRSELDAIASASPEERLSHGLTRPENPFVPIVALAPYFPLRSDVRERWLATLEQSGAIRRAGESVLLSARLRALEDAVERDLETYHQQEPLAPGKGAGELRMALNAPMTDADFEWFLDEMARNGRIAREGHLVRLPSHQVAFGDEDATIRDRVEGVFQEGGPSTPSFAEVATLLAPTPASRVSRILQTLVHLGVLVRIADDYWLHRDVYARTLDQLRAYLSEHATLGIGEFRDLTGASRKYAVPFLEAI